MIMREEASKNLEELMQSTPSYCILDSAAPHVLENLYKINPVPEHLHLFESTRYKTLISVSPLLIAVTYSSPLTAHFLQCNFINSGFIFGSTLPEAELLASLRFALTVSMPEGSNALFRYYDPQIFLDLLTAESYNPIIPIANTMSWFAARNTNMHNMSGWHIAVNSEPAKPITEWNEAFSPDALEYLQEAETRRTVTTHIANLCQEQGQESGKVTAPQLQNIWRNFTFKIYQEDTSFVVDTATYEKTLHRLDELEERFNITSADDLLEADLLLQTIEPAQYERCCELLSNNSIPMRMRLEDIAKLRSNYVR